MINRAICACAWTLLLIPAAHAQNSFGGALSLGYAEVESDGLTADGPIYGLDLKGAAGRFTYDLGASSSTLSDDGDDITSRRFDALGRYWFSENYSAGAYISRQSIDLDIGDIAVIDSYGLEIAGRFGNVDVAGFAGQTDLDELATIVDVTDIGIRGGFAPTGAINVFGSYVYSEFELAGDDADAYNVGLGGSYAFGNGFSVFGGVQRTEIDDADAKLDVSSIGLSYQFDTARMPVILSGEYARANGSALGFAEDADRLSLGATILFGDAQAKRVPDHSVLSGISSGNRSALDGLLSSVGF